MAVDYNREAALLAAVEFHKSSIVDPAVVISTADAFRKFIIGAWPAATPDEVKELEAEAARPDETTVVGS